MNSKNKFKVGDKVVITLDFPSHVYTIVGMQTGRGTDTIDIRSGKYFWTDMPASWFTLASQQSAKAPPVPSNPVDQYSVGQCYGGELVSLPIPQQEDKKCTCDFIKQLLPYGCSCGGK
jgi:hypothetical protein